MAINFLWKHIRSIWVYRNTVVHGSNDQGIAAKIRKASTDKVREYYNTFRTAPTFIRTRHKYLFTSRSLDQRLKLDIDSLNCWIRSVEDAIQALIHHNNPTKITLCSILGLLFCCRPSSPQSWNTRIFRFRLFSFFNGH
jgi:hypothetical protein